MIGGIPGETAGEYAARKAREEALDSGAEVEWEGMTMQRRKDGFYLNGEKVEEPPTKAQQKAQEEARKIPTRVRDTDWQRRGKGGETRVLQPPTEPISTGAGARTVTEEPDPLALEWPCPACEFRGKTDGGRRNHFTRRHPRLLYPTEWPEPVPKTQEEPMGLPDLSEVEKRAPSQRPQVTRAEIGPTDTAAVLKEMTGPTVLDPQENGTPAFLADIDGDMEEQAWIAAGRQIQVDREKALKAIDEEPPWAPLYARADTLLQVVGKCAEHLIPLSQRDQAVAMRWLTELLED